MAILVSKGDSMWVNLLKEVYMPYYEQFKAGSPLFEALEAERQEAKRKDDEYLASLSEVERRKVLLMRRIDNLEARYRNWWEENMAWRFAPRRPDYDDYYG